MHLVCGGRWHDFDFARLQLLQLLAEHDHVRTTVASDYRDRAVLERASLLITYTCDVRPTVAQQRALASFVASGGKWLALHATNAALERRRDGLFAAPRVLGPVAEVLGSQFIAHPPIEPYVVDNVAPDHPLVAGIPPFEVDDELYLCERHAIDEQEVLLATEWSGDTGRGFVEHEWHDREPRPVMYLRPYGDGVVLYNTLGHCRGHYDMADIVARYPVVERGAWDVEEFRTLLRRSIRWGIGELQS